MCCGGGPIVDGVVVLHVDTTEVDEGCVVVAGGTRRLLLLMGDLLSSSLPLPDGPAAGGPAKEVQKFALRICSKNYDSSYEDLLDTFQLPKLSTRH